MVVKRRTESNDVIKTAKTLIIGVIEFPENVEKKDIFNLITGKEFTGGIMNCFLNNLKLNDVDVEVICPLFFSSLNNEKRIKNTVNTVSLMDKNYIFSLPLNLHGIHWALVIVISQKSTLLYFYLLLMPSNPTNQLNFATSFFNFYCVAHNVQLILCDYVICD